MFHVIDAYYSKHSKCIDRHLVENASPISFVTELSERVQRASIAKIFRTAHLSYEDTLQQLNIDSVESRRKSDLLLCFKLVHGFTDIEKMISSLLTMIMPH